MRGLGVACGLVVGAAIEIGCAGSPAGTGEGAEVSASAVSTSSTSLGGCEMFPADNAWNEVVDKLPLNASSATYIANMSPSTHLHPDWGDWSKHHYGIPWQTVPGTQTFVPMTFKNKSQSDPGPYPFPPTALIEGGGKAGDRHVLVLDTGSCELYETWHSVYDNPGWTCGSGATFDMSSDALRPDGWTSADAAGLPILPGLVKLAEVQAGAITHAIRFTISSSQEGYIHPATHAAGSSNTSLPPMGLRLRLKSSFDLSGFTGPSRVILKAMKTYGIILADNGSDWYITGDSDDGWTKLMGKISSDFDQVTGADFEAVDTGTISTKGL